MAEDLTPGSDPRDAAPSPGPASGFGTAGAMIRAAREAQGLDLASLAAMLKVPLRRIEALEQGRHDELQGATFERALAQAACRVLKIDPKPVLALLPQHQGNTLEGVTEGINAPFRERTNGSATLGDVAVVFRPVVLVPALLVVVALALFLMPDGLVSRLVRPLVAGGGSPAPAASANLSGAPLAIAS